MGPVSRLICLSRSKARLSMASAAGLPPLLLDIILTGVSASCKSVVRVGLGDLFFLVFFLVTTAL